jgi:hypothetical protein
MKHILLHRLEYYIIIDGKRMVERNELLYVDYHTIFIQSFL